MMLGYREWKIGKMLVENQSIDDLINKAIEDIVGNEDDPPGTQTIAGAINSYLASRTDESFGRWLSGKAGKMKGYWTESRINRVIELSDKEQGKDWPMWFVTKVNEAELNRHWIGFESLTNFLFEARELQNVLYRRGMILNESNQELDELRKKIRQHLEDLTNRLRQIAKTAHTPAAAATGADQDVEFANVPEEPAQPDTPATAPVIPTPANVNTPDIIEGDVWNKMIDPSKAWFNWSSDNTFNIDLVKFLSAHNINVDVDTDENKKAWRNSVSRLINQLIRYAEEKSGQNNAFPGKKVQGWLNDAAKIRNRKLTIGFIKSLADLMGVSLPKKTQPQPQPQAPAVAAQTPPPPPETPEVEPEWREPNKEEIKVIKRLNPNPQMSVKLIGSAWGGPLGSHWYDGQYFKTGGQYIDYLINDKNVNPRSILKHNSLLRTIVNNATLNHPNKAVRELGRKLL